MIEVYQKASKYVFMAKNKNIPLEEINKYLNDNFNISYNDYNELERKSLQDLDEKTDAMITFL